MLKGRDATEKGGVIKRTYNIPVHVEPTSQHFADRPSGRAWQLVFSAFCATSSGPQEFVLFNRRWYNRAGIAHIMGFCTDSEYEHFMATVIYFEQILVYSGIRLHKSYLNISREEQHKRLEAHKVDP